MATIAYLMLNLVFNDVFFKFYINNLMARNIRDRDLAKINTTGIAFKGLM
jgi:hypothetical protein